MEIEESDSSKQLKLCQLIESNCEYLTLIRNQSTQRYRSQKNSLKTIQRYMEQYGTQSKVKLSYESLLQLFIELGYFLYTFRNFGKAAIIEMDGIRVQETFIKAGEKKFMVVIFYKIEDKTMEDMEATNLYHGIFQHIQTALTPYFERPSNNTETPNTQAQFEQAYKTFENQYKTITSCTFFEDKQPYFFKALEQTNLYYTYSMFYRIKNCSMLEFIRSDLNRFKDFKDARQKDETFLAQYRQEKKKIKGDPQALRAKERQIDANLLAFFKKINPSYFIENPTSKNDKDQSCRARFHFLLKQKHKQSFNAFIKQLEDPQAQLEPEPLPQESSQMRPQNKAAASSYPKRPLSDLQFYIEYSSERNSICVRLFMPTISVNIDTSDLLMFQSNVLTFQAVNVSIQLSEPKVSAELKAEMKPQNKPSVKIVAFKSTSSFNVKQPFLTKILMLMDITMIASRIYEPELNSQKSGQSAGKDIYHRLATISKKVNHYTKLFMKCAKKIYDE